MKPPSQNDRILAALKDGCEHEMRDIHRVAGFSRLNSRVAELRKRGYAITCRREGNFYWYRLLSAGPVFKCAVDESAGQSERLALTRPERRILRDIKGTTPL